MLRPFAVAVLAALAAAPADAATIRLSTRDAEVHALSVTGGLALAIVDSGLRAPPFELVATRGGGSNSIGRFAMRESEFPDVSVDKFGRVVAAWSRPISGGAAIEALAVDLAGAEPFGPVRWLGESTGPPRLAVSDGSPVLAFPDRNGNLALISGPTDGGAERPAAGRTPYVLTTSAPARRHLPLDLVIGPDGPLVLDLAQTRALTELRLIGPGAPAAPITSARGVRALPAGVAADDARIVAAYLSSGRVVFATARADGTWSRRRLPGPGGGIDPPAVMLAEGDALVAYEQRVPDRRARRSSRRLFLTRISGGRVTTTRLTRSQANDRRPIAAADPVGEAYVAWTRTLRGSGRRVPLLARVD